jgi:hypothetical protein
LTEGRAAEGTTEGGVGLPDDDAVGAALASAAAEEDVIGDEATAATEDAAGNAAGEATDDADDATRPAEVSGTRLRIATHPKRVATTAAAPPKSATRPLRGGDIAGLETPPLVLAPLTASATAALAKLGLGLGARPSRTVTAFPTAAFSVSDVAASDADGHTAGAFGSSIARSSAIEPMRCARSFTRHPSTARTT